jgi:predicted O-linked N-acetylglucosamine transferase (SPINDLY family)
MTFDSWMRILSKVDNGVLWLLAESSEFKENLVIQAKARGITKERLIFSNRIELSEHLARQKLADLVLDTFPWNAHTTASDALWVGLPLITLSGNTFPGRVASSLLNAVGLPELITKDKMTYESLAIELASNPEKLAQLRQKLAQNILSEPLFDSFLYKKNLEYLFENMMTRYLSGLPVDHLSVNLKSEEKY